MTDIDEMVTDVRLIALETITQKTLAYQFAQYEPGHSRDLKTQLIETCSKIDVLQGEGPTLVDGDRLKVLADHVEHFIAVVEERETDIRERTGAPPLIPLND